MAVEQARKRNLNRGQILKALHFDGPLRRGELGRRLGIRGSSVSNIVSELPSLGLLRERDPGSARSPVQLDTEEFHAVAASVTADALHFARVYLGRRVEEVREAPLEGDSTPERILKALAKGFASLLRTSKEAPLGVGVATPGVVDPETGRVRQAVYLSGWRDVPLGEKLSCRLSRRVMVENDVRCQLWACAWFDRLLKESDDILCVGILGGIACSTIARGRRILGERHSAGGRDMVYSCSLYHNVNMYNVFRMLETLVAASPDADRTLAARYSAWGDDLERAIKERFVDPEQGRFFAGHTVFADGSREWQKFEKGCEHAWAVSVGPFFPCLRTALRSARAVREEWPAITAYGYCPWNTLARMLKEFGMSSADYKAMLADEVREALMLTEKHPMKGAFTEYFGNVEGWRALPFSAGTFLNTVGSPILSGLPAGLAVRASDLVERVTNYAFRASRIDATSSGEGDTVASATVNGTPLVATLQIPETLLRASRNEVKIVRGGRDAGPRLFSSDARLFAVESDGKSLVYRMASPACADLVFEGLGPATSVTAAGADGKDIPAEVSEIEGTDKSVVTLRPAGDFTVAVRR